MGFKKSRLVFKVMSFFGLHIQLFHTCRIVVRAVTELDFENSRNGIPLQPWLQWKISKLFCFCQVQFIIFCVVISVCLGFSVLCQNPFDSEILGADSLFGVVFFDVFFSWPSRIGLVTRISTEEGGEFVTRRPEARATRSCDRRCEMLQVKRSQHVWGILQWKRRRGCCFGRNRGREDRKMSENQNCLRKWREEKK